MRSYRFGLATIAASALLAFAPHLATAAPSQSDTYCPRAAAGLDAFAAATQGAGEKDTRKIADAARQAADEYQLCIAEATTRVVDEPRINYDRTKAAYFLLVEARALGAAGDIKGAWKAAYDSRKLADFVAKWQPTSLGSYQNNNGSGYVATRTTDRNGSAYAPDAKSILTGDDELIGALAAKLRAEPAPQAGAPQGTAPQGATAPPAPAASPHP